MTSRFRRCFLFLALAAAFASTPIPSAWATTTARKATTHKGKAKGKGRKKRGKVFLERKVAATRNGLPNIQAQGAVVIDLDSGHDLYTRDADRARPIASISKLAAALVFDERKVDLDGLTTISHLDIEVARGGAPSRLKEGMTLSNRDLLHAALLGSDNRAIPALGRAVGLQPMQLAAAMTRKAEELGLKHTRFRDPTGLSPENVSTPRELTVLLQTVMKSALLGPIVRRLEYEAHPVGRPPLRYVNTHKPAHRSNLEVLGGKTGFNNAARYCLVLAAKVDGHRYCMAFLGDEGKLTRFGDVARVADWILARKPKPAAVAAAAAGAAAHGGVTPAASTPTPTTVKPGPLEPAVAVTPSVATGPAAAGLAAPTSASVSAAAVAPKATAPIAAPSPAPSTIPSDSI